jgi:hypothetical protein
VESSRPGEATWSPHVLETKQARVESSRPKNTTSESGVLTSGRQQARAGVFETQKMFLSLRLQIIVCYRTGFLLFVFGGCSGTDSTVAAPLYWPLYQPWIVDGDMMIVEQLVQ